MQISFDMTLVPSGVPNQYAPRDTPALDFGPFTTGTQTPVDFAQNGCVNGCYDGSAGSTYSMLNVVYVYGWVPGVVVSMSGNDAIAIAINAAGQVASTCTTGESGCYTAADGFGNYNLTGPNIEEIVAGGIDGTVANVRSVNVPAPDTLVMLGLALTALWMASQKMALGK